MREDNGNRNRKFLRQARGRLFDCGAQDDLFILGGFLPVMAREHPIAIAAFVTCCLVIHVVPPTPVLKVLKSSK